jgi:hypothetical protein
VNRGVESGCAPHGSTPRAPGKPRCEPERLAAVEELEAAALAPLRVEGAAGPPLNPIAIF